MRWQMCLDGTSWARLEVRLRGAVGRTMNRQQRLVLAKIGLDGHDRGVKVVARGLRDAGFHVIYAGLWQPLEAVVQAVSDEDADWLGVSILNGAHLTQITRLMELLRDAGLDHVGVIVGGIIPEADVPELERVGVAGVFGPGTAICEIVDFLRERDQVASLDELLERLRNKDRRALSSLLSWASQPELARAIRDRIGDCQSKSPVIAITGSGGVGKSSLIRRLVELVRSSGNSIAVLACDPESPLSGGALLGDRIRMAGAADADVFIRSLAAKPGQQALAANLDLMATLLSTFGFEIILVETAGAGQGDTAVQQVADVLVMLVQPQTGDELQWEKAGLLEVADVVVVNKSDLPGAEHVRTQLESQLTLPGGRHTPVLAVSSTKPEGLTKLWAEIVGKQDA